MEDSPQPTEDQPEGVSEAAAHVLTAVPVAAAATTTGAAAATLPDAAAATATTAADVGALDGDGVATAVTLQQGAGSGPLSATDSVDLTGPSSQEEGAAAAAASHTQEATMPCEPDSPSTSSSPVGAVSFICRA